MKRYTLKLCTGSDTEQYVIVAETMNTSKDTNTYWFHMRGVGRNKDRMEVIGIFPIDRTAIVLIENV